MNPFYTKVDNNVGDDNDDTNYFLYNALCQAFIYKNPKTLEHPMIFKDKLGVNRWDTVDLIKHIDQLEFELQLNINVSGSIERESDNSYPR